MNTMARIFVASALVVTTCMGVDNEIVSIRAAKGELFVYMLHSANFFERNDSMYK